MKKISKTSAKRMIAALRYALAMVKDGRSHGLCLGIVAASRRNVCSSSDSEYLRQWIQGSLRGFAFIEGYAKRRPPYTLSADKKYQLRKPWVEWMIQHLKETT